MSKTIKILLTIFLSSTVFSLKAHSCECGTGVPTMEEQDSRITTIDRFVEMSEGGCNLFERFRVTGNPQVFASPVCSDLYPNPLPTGGGGGGGPGDIRRERQQCGSVINVDNLSVGESVEVVGTDMRLHYMSDRVRGRSKEYTVGLPILDPLGPEIDLAEVTQVRVRTLWDGDSEVSVSAPGSLQNFTFTWDGLTREGEEQLAPLKLDLRLEYFLGATSQTLFRSGYLIEVGNYNPRVYGFGGWTLSEHHFLDVDNDKLYRGDGTREKILAIEAEIQPDGKYKKFQKRLRAGYPDAVGASFQNKMPFTEPTHYLIASKDGERVFVFDLEGKHFETRSVKTGGLIYAFEYDADQKLTKITNSYGREIIINRPTSSQVTITSFGGKTTTLNLNSDGYTESVTEPIGNTHTMTYTSDGLMLTYTNPKNKISTFTYSSDGRLIEDRNNSGFRTIFEILEELNDRIVIRQTTKENLVTDMTSEFNSSDEVDGGVRRTVTNPSGSVETFRDTIEAATTFTDRDGFSFSRSYRINDPFEGHSEYVSQYLITTGNKTEPIFSDFVTNVDTETDLLTIISENTNRTFDGRIWSENYEDSTKTMTYTSPLGRTSSYTINDFNQVTQERDSNFLAVDYGYDPLGRLSSISQGTRTWNYTYNAEDELESLTDPLGRITSFIYDDNSRPVEINNAGRVSKLLYDGAGNIIGVKPPGKPFHRFTTELFNALRKYLIPSIGGAPKEEVNYTYDDDYRLQKITRPNGEEIDFIYQADTGYLKRIRTNEGDYIRNYKATTDQLMAAFHPNGQRTGFSYEADLLRNVNNKYNDITTDNVTIYDKLKVDVKRVTARETSLTSRAKHLYDDDDLLRKVGSLVIVRYPDSGLTQRLVLNTVRESHTYTEYGELRLRRVFLDDGTEFFKEIYVRDDLGRIRVRREFVNSFETKYRYVYDPQGKIKRIFKNDILDKEFTYDGNGNRSQINEQGLITATGVYDEADRITTYGSLTFEHDDFGNQTKKTDTVTNIETTYNHDSLGALESVNITDTVSSTTDTITYINDGLGRRLVRLKNGVFTNRYIYNEDIRIEGETNEDGTSLTHYIYGTRINVPDYMDRDGIRYKLITDYVGSVRMVVNAENNSIVQEITYDEFGRVLSDTNPGFQPFYFAGGLYDVDTKLLRFGARDYDAETGRWTSVDPIRFEGGTTNLYSYVNNDSINYIDPEGKGPIGFGLCIGLGALSTFDFIRDLRKLRKDLDRNRSEANQCEEDSDERQEKDQEYLELTRQYTQRQIRGVYGGLGVGIACAGLVASPL